MATVVQVGQAWRLTRPSLAGYPPGRLIQITAVGEGGIAYRYSESGARGMAARYHDFTKYFELARDGRVEAR